jgi:Subtilase family
MMRSRMVLAALAVCLAVPAAFAEAVRPTTDAATGVKTFTLPDGSTARVGSDGLGWRTDRSGVRGAPFTVMRPQGQAAVGGSFGPSDLEIQRRLALPSRGRFAPGRVIVSVPGATSQVGAAATNAARTGDPRVDETLRSVGARSMRAVSGGSNLFVVDVAGDDPVRAARKLRATAGVAYAEPDWIVSSMATEPKAIPQTALRPVRAQAQSQAGTTQASLPSNFGLQSSLQSWLNAAGVNAVGAYADIARRFGQLPGEGTIVTNVSIGDLTDQAMADAGDFYVQFFGPTTRVIGRQRYLDVPSLPLIPTYAVDASGAIDPLGTVEFVDPLLGEVLLDFSVMAPLPHDRQRPEAQGSGPTDLLGIAPGAQYRLVVPKEPTISNILTAMLAAAQQSPRPDVISASLGFGTDSVGFPGRYLEDDPIAQSVVSTIVQKYGIVVAISANDGTRIFTLAAVGPDGGSAATDLLPRGGVATSVADDALSTAPTLVADSGALAVGGVTLDDIFSAPPQSGGVLSRLGQFPTTRYNGGGGFSSGFGTRVNISAPSDNIASFVHSCDSGGCPPDAVIPVLSGGTSASAPMTAAAAAVVLQVARLTHQRLTPSQVRDLLVRTARPTTDAPQSDRSLHVGPQLDVTAAVESLLGIDKRTTGAIVRVSVAHRQAFQDLGETFLEATDTTAIDLLGPTFNFGDFQFSLGQNAVAPITIAADVTNLPRDSGTTFALRIGSMVLTSSQPSFRLLPEEILSAAGFTLAADGDRTVTATVEARRSGRVIDSRDVSLTFGPTDGTYAEGLAPSVQPVVPAGSGVVVHYDLRSVRAVNNPVLVISSVNHFSPVMAPFFRSETSIPLKTLVGDVTVPASAFAAGAGLYGIGTITDPDSFTFGEFAIVRAGPDASGRPDAPTLDDGTGSFGHSLAVTRAAPRFQVRWDVRSVSGADGAMLEISAPAPTLFGALNTFTNQNGDRRDQNGVESASTSLQALPGAAGTTELDAIRLNLPSSLFYNVRVFATTGGKIVGQASASSGLEFDDGLTPGGAFVTNFDITGSSAIVALSSFDLSGRPVDSSLNSYSTSTGTYAAPFADDPSGQTLYSVIGNDPDLHASAVIRFPFFFDARQEVQVYDTRTGALRSSVPVDLATESFLINGRVDGNKHRAAVLGLSATDFTDQVFPVDLSTGALGTPFNPDVGLDFGGVFNSIDVDSASGRAILGQSFYGDICIAGRFGFIGEVDLDDGTTLPVASAPSCMSAFAADQRGRNVFATLGPVFSFPRIIAPGRLQNVDQGRLTQIGPVKQLGANGPVFAAVDPVNNLLVVAFLAGSDYLVNNVAMSSVGVYDSRSGKQISLSQTFNFASEVFASTLLFIGERGIQLDPARRIAWTFGPGGTQVQQFSY